MLVISHGELKSFQVGLSKEEIVKKINEVKDFLTTHPEQIQIHNKTKNCNVTLQVVGGTFNIVITNPDDELFRL